MVLFLAALATLAGRPASAQEPEIPGDAPQPAVEPAGPLHFRARVHARYEVFEEEPKHAFVLPEARLAVNAEPLPWLGAQIDVDFSSAVALRDGFVDVGPQWLRLRLGRFKRPFSRLQLMSLRTVPLWRRGIVNRVIVRNFGFGDRDRGAKLHGRIGGFGYEAGVFNGSDIGSRDSDFGKDAVARVRYRFSKALRVGASGSLRYASNPQNPVARPRKDRWATEIDARVRLGNFDMLAEATWAQGPRTRLGPEYFGALIYFMYRVKLAENLKLRPLVKAEILDHNVYKTDDVALSVTAGVNLHLTKWLRVMLQGENVWSQANSEMITPDERIAILQLAFEYGHALYVVEEESQ